MPPYLGERWRSSECRATTCFSLTQDLVTHLTVNLIPSLSILSPGRVGAGVGAAVTRYRAPDVLWIRMTGVFTPFQKLQDRCWWRRCVTPYGDSGHSSHSFWCRFCLNHLLFHPIPNWFFNHVLFFWRLLSRIFPSLCHNVFFPSPFYLYQPAPPLSQLSPFLSRLLWHLPKVCSGCAPSIFGCHWGPTTAATVVGHGAAAVILYSPVLHLSCTASPMGVIPTDLLWKFKCSA